MTYPQNFPAAGKNSLSVCLSAKSDLIIRRDPFPVDPRHLIASLKESYHLWLISAPMDGPSSVNIALVGIVVIISIVPMEGRLSRRVGLSDLHRGRLM